MTIAPEGTTHLPKQQFDNKCYYKWDEKKRQWFRWSDSYPCWDFCGTSVMNTDKLEGLYVSDC